MKLTKLQKQALYHIKVFGTKSKWTQDNRKIALALEKKGLVKRIDERGNHFKLDFTSNKLLTQLSIIELDKTEVVKEKPKLKKYLLFTYGTLMRGYGNHRCIEGSKFLGTDRVKGFDMYSMSAYPCVKIGDEEKIVYGEIFEITEEQFKRCDSLEGYPRFYNRKEVTTETGKKVIIYFIEKDNYPNLSLVESGNWREFKKPTPYEYV